MTATIVGVGLIGGSLAISLKEKGMANWIIGVDQQQDNLQKAQELKIIDEAATLEDALELAENLVDILQMRLVYMNAEEHDLHTAYVSHISHITSFALALTVLKKEKEQGRIFELASGGFESTVRLAKSSPDMWVPI